MRSTHRLLALWLLLAAAATPAAAPPPPPKPPPGLAPWVEYARSAHKASADCPRLRLQSQGGQAPVCTTLYTARLTGTPETGRLTLAVTGESWARTPQELALVGPADVVTVTSGTARGGGAPELRLDVGSNQWRARVPEGAFSFTVELSFDPRPTVELQIPGPVAHFDGQLTGGTLRIDEDSAAWHGGVLRIESGSGAAAVKDQEPLTLRVVRVLHWGSVPTFSYHYTLSAVREQTELVLPLLGTERVETMEPDRAFERTDSGLRVTVAPGPARSVVVKGHLPEAVPRLVKPKGLPFEHWLFVTDQRHPVRLAAGGREIDPGAVEGVAVPVGSRAFFLTDEQDLRIEAIEVRVDEGRGGSGETAYLYVQGEQGHWVGNLSLKARLPKQDRLPVRTPAPPHFAERGGAATRMFKDPAGVLSVQLDEALAKGSPMRLQWREDKAIGKALSVLRFELPAQTLHLDRQSLAVHFAPGFVPVAAFGSDLVEGHLFDRFRIFALLMGLLAFVLCKAARFPTWLAVVFAALFASLFDVQGFPAVPLFFLLAATAVLARLPDDLIAKLRNLSWLQGIVAAVWLVFLAIGTVPLISFVQERVHSAIHPWAHNASHVYVDNYSLNYLRQAKMTGTDVSRSLAVDGRFELSEEEEQFDAPASGEDNNGDIAQRQIQLQVDQGMVRGESDKAGGEGGYRAGLLASRRPAKRRRWKGRGKGKRRAAGAQAPAEKSMRPVALDQPHLPGTVLRQTSRSLLPGQALNARVLVAGPWLRGLWLFLEALLLLGLVYQVMRGSGPLWRASKEVQA